LDDVGVSATLLEVASVNEELRVVVCVRIGVGETLKLLGVVVDDVLLLLPSAVGVLGVVMGIKGIGAILELLVEDFMLPSGGGAGTQELATRERGERLS
jgi:hypothetical protein